MIFRVLTFVTVSVVIYLGIAFGLILSQRPGVLPPGEGLDFTSVIERGAGERLPQTMVQMRDGWEMPVRYAASQVGDAPLVVMIHGSGWHGMQYNRLARTLSDQAGILAPDLRGHGANPKRRGDIDHTGQFEEDLADLIDAFAKPGQKVLMLGHSSGGGLVARFAGGAYGRQIDAAVLLAPLLQYDAPTMRPDAGGWATPLTRRIIGLSMLSNLGIHSLDHLTVIQFSMPEQVLDGPLGHTATAAYSRRLNESYAPRRNWQADIAALPEFTLVVGSEDEAFLADQFEPVLKNITSLGKYVMIDGLNHLSVVDAPETEQVIRDMLNAL